MKSVLAIALLGLVSCWESEKSFRESVKEALNVDHVFKYPTQRYIPGTIISYDTMNDTVKVECDPHSYVDFPQPTEGRYRAKLNHNAKSAEAAIVRKGEGSFKFEIPVNPTLASGLGVSASAKFIGTIRLTNGVIVSSEIDFDRLYLDAAAPRFVNCASRIKLNRDSSQRFKYYILRDVYQYDIQTEFTSAAGAKVEGELRKHLEAQLAAKAGLEHGSSFSGNNLTFATTWTELSRTARTKCVAPLAGSYNIKLDLNCTNDSSANKSVPSGRNGLIEADRFGHMRDTIILRNINPKCDSLNGFAFVTITTYVDDKPYSLYQSPKVNAATNYPDTQLELDLDNLGQNRNIWLDGRIRRTGVDELTFEYDVGMACTP